MTANEEMMEKKHRQTRAWSPLWRLLQPVRLQVVAVAAYSFFGAMAEAAMLVLLTQIAMGIFQSTGEIYVLHATLSTGASISVAASLLLVRLLLGVGSVHASASLSQHLRTELQTAVSRSFIDASWPKQQEQPAGRLQEITTTFVQQAMEAVETFIALLTASLSLCSFIVMALLIDPVSTGIVLVALLFFGVALRPLRRRVSQAGVRSANAGLGLTNAVAEIGGLGLEMHVFGTQRQFAGHLKRLIKGSAQAQYARQLNLGLLTPFYQFLAYGAVVAGVAALSVQEPSNVASLGAILLLMLRAVAYGQGVQAWSGAIGGTVPYVARIQDTVSEYSKSTPERGKRIPYSVTPLKATNVTFSYDGREPALKNASFTIFPNEMIGVIGPSGAGKSTLVQLLLGLRSPEVGQITVGDSVLTDIDKAWWTERVAAVPQEAILFGGSISDNIKFFRNQLTANQIRRASLQANVLNDIEGLPEGFETRVGDHGAGLSGGQKQRLSIARALVGDPELIVLDEPTSALDPESEALIRDSLSRLRGQATIVIIAHRMSVLDVCDRIMVIEEGRITGFDTPENLRSQNDFYREALSLQEQRT